MRVSISAMLEYEDFQVSWKAVHVKSAAFIPLFSLPDTANEAEILNLFNI